MQPLTPEELTRALSGFDVHSLIAADSISHTYQATQTTLHRPVTLKVLPAPLAADERYLRLFQAQAKTLAKLNHPNLISVYDIGSQDSIHFVVTELTSGQTLSELTAKQTLPQNQACRVIRDVCLGLQHAHDSGLYHGGLTSANISLDPRLKPTLRGFTGMHAKASASSDVRAAADILHQILTTYSVPPSGTPATPSSYCNCSPSLDPVLQNALTGKISAENFAQLLTPFIDAAPAAKASSPQPERAPREGNNVVRNLIVIACLLMAIIFVWERYREKEQIVEIASAAAPEAPKPPPAATQEKKLNPEKEITTTTPAPAPAEPRTITVISLEDAATELSRGKRETFPTGTAFTETSAFYCMPGSLDWGSAQIQAESAGAFLACPRSVADLKKLTRVVPENEKAWLGAAMAGKTSWTWIDSSPFILEVPEPEETSRLVVDEFGILTPGNLTEARPAIIQWNLDGSTPGTLDEQLNRSDSKQSIFPPGTFAIGSRHYYIYPEKTTWETGLRKAARAGGHLAALAGPREGIALSAALRSRLPRGTTAWLGGEYNGSEWTWSNGEPWLATAITPAPSADGDTLAIVVGNGIVYTLETGSAYPIIAWSEETIAEEKIHIPELEELRKLAKKKVESLTETREEDSRKNRRVFDKQFGEILSKLPEDQANRLSIKFQDLTSFSGRESSAALSALPFNVRDHYSQYLRKEKLINAKVNQQLLILRRSYLKRIAALERTISQESLAQLEIERENLGLTASDFETFALRP